jgi:PAS domain S-box-containing protein
VQRTLTFRTLIGAAALAVVLVGLFYVMATGIGAQGASSDRAAQSDRRTVAAGAELTLVVTLETSLRGFMITEEEAFLAPWRRALSNLPQARARFEQVMRGSKQDEATIRELDRELSDYVDGHGRAVIALIKSGRSTREQRAAITLDGGRQLAHIRAHLIGVIDRERAAAAAARGDATEQLDRGLVVGTVGFGSTVLLVMLFAGHQMRYVLRPVRRVGGAARRVAGGDLSARVAEVGAGEVADLGRSFNVMADSLEHTRYELESQNSELEAQQAELERAVDELAHEKDRIERMYRVGRAISSGTELDEVSSAVVAELAEFAKADIGVVYATTAADGSAEPIAARGIDVAALVRLVPNAGLGGRALAECRTLHGAYGETRLRVPALGGDVAVAHELHLPLVSGSEAVGVVTLARLSGGPFAADDVEQLDYLAGRAASGIANALTLRAARDQAALNRAVLETAADAFVTIDRNNAITAWNAAAERMFGWTAAEAIGQSALETFIPEGNHDLQRRMLSGEAPLPGAGRPIEVDARARDGRQFPVELTISPLERDGELTFNAFMRDITDRRRAERYIAAHLELTRVLSEATTLEEAHAGGIRALGEALGWDVGFSWRVDGQSGLVTPVASWAADGVDADAFRSAVLGTTFERGQGLPGRVWAAGEPIWMDELPRDGSFLRLAAAERAGVRSAISFPVIGRGGQIIGTAEFFSRERIDSGAETLALLTTIGAQIGQFVERKLTELETDRLKDEFFALVSHELRTPLTSIVGYLEMVLEDSDEIDPQTTRFLQVVERNSLRLQRLVGDLLFVAQVEAGRLSIDRTEVPLDRVVADSVEAARPWAGDSGVELDVRASDVCVSNGDPDRLGQMLDNLISNAVKFTPEGGKVSVELASRGGRARIEVRDTGVGIPEKEQNRLFERFFRSSTATERAIPGVGLGLTISRAIVEAHGGTIDFTSEEGRGTTFVVDLPLASSRPQADPRKTPKEVVL